MIIHESLPPLNRTPMMESHHYEEANAMLTKVIGPVTSEWLEPKLPFVSRLYYSKLNQSSMVYLQWQGAQKLIRYQPDDFYLFYLPLDGIIEEEINQSSPFISSPEMAHLFTPQQKLVGRIDSKGQGISVCIPRQKLHQEMAKLLNHSLNKLIIFQTEVDLKTHFGYSFKELILFAWHATGQNSLFLSQLEQMMITAILENHSHNYSSLLCKPCKLASDRQVKLAQEFMQANLENAISLGDIAAAIGVSGRSLQRAFAKYCGCSLLQFLRQLRLDALHQELKTGITPDSNITDVMLKYQFSHLGRCSQQYQERFGELPSETLNPKFRR